MQDLDFWRDFGGPFYGFDHVELARNHTDEPHVGQHYALWMESKGCTNWPDYFRPPTGNTEKQRWTWNIPEELHYNTWIAERTNALMEQFNQDGESFLLWASFFDPHPSYLVPEPWDKMYDPDQITVPSITPGEHTLNPPHFQLTQEAEPDFSAYQEPDGHNVQGFHSHLRDRDGLAKDIAIYYGMVSCMDKYIGQILNRLDELELAENTLVVFTSDHGHFFGQHGLIWKGPFHYEDMIRVPLIVSLPGTVPCGQRSSSLQSLVDLAPTLMNFTELEIPRTMTGVVQTDVWCGRASSCRNHIIVEDRHQPTTVHVKTYVNERFKITVYFNQQYGELFDLRDDPGELHNRWADPNFDKIKSELLLEFLHAEMGKEPLWMPRISGA
jgi:arylsulfatase A-like enzyme